jgi:hypothetical protein
MKEYKDPTVREEVSSMNEIVGNLLDGIQAKTDVLQ